MPKRPSLPNASRKPAETSTPSPSKPEATKQTAAKQTAAKPAAAKRSAAKQPAKTPGSTKTGPKSTTHTVAPVMSTPSGTGRWLRGIHFSAFSLVMMGILVLAVVILAPTLQAFVQQRQQIADQQAVVDSLTQQVDAAKAQRARWNDPSYIRAQARDRLYYVMPGETSYLVIDDRPPAAATADAPVTSTLQKTHTDWVGSLFGSFMGAGLTDATPQQLTGQTGDGSGTPTSTPTPSK
jgi:cell division protein FtsB